MTESIPDVIDPSWWSRHEHLFRWNERRRVFKFTPGYPRDDGVEGECDRGS